MLKAAREATSFAAGKKRDDLNTNRMLVLSIIKDIEIIGEAAAKVSAACRSELGAIPWQDVIGMRNHLIHGYYDIDLDVLWQTITDDLPLLVYLLTRIDPPLTD